MTADYYEAHEPLSLDAAGPASPSYTAVAHEQERTVSIDYAALTPSRGILLTDPDTLWDPTESYCYVGDMLSVSLGPHSWGLRYPAYGAKAEVQGAVRLGPKCTHTTKLSVSVSL